MKKLLFFLPANKLWVRVLRRAVVVAILTFLAMILKEAVLPIAPSIWIPVISAGLMTLDKLIRELITKNKE